MNISIVVFALAVMLHPAAVRSEAIVQPVRCVEVISSDDVGNELSYPSALFYDAESDEIYVTSPLKNKLVILTSSYFPYMSIGAGRGLHNAGSCFQKEGLLYVCNGAGKDDRRPHLFLPRKVVVGESGNIYVAGLAGFGVVVLDGDGNYLRQIEPRDEALGVAERATIISMDIDGSGNLYLLSETMGRVYVYDRNENFLYKFGQKGGDVGKLARPRGIAVDDRNRRVFVVDYQRHSVSAFSLSGDFLYEFGGMGSGRGWLNYPSDLCVDGFGRVLVADTFNHRVQVFEIVESRHRTRTQPGSPAAASAANVDEPVVTVELSATDSAAEYVLQVAFARNPADAQRLYERLAAKGYAVSTEQVDQGEKGVWQRVQIGPFSVLSQAKEVAERLRVEENLMSLVKKKP
ncbi:MAG: SPOR domain-containing protein [Desulfuromonadaceae bacterium]